MKDQFVESRRRPGYSSINTLGARLLIYGPYNTTEVDISQGTFTIGRSPEADISVDDPSLSRVHAALEIAHAEKGLRCTIKDLDSRNGTYVKGILADHHRPVDFEAGELVEAGHTALVVRQGPRNTEPDAPTDLDGLSNRLERLCESNAEFSLLLIEAPASAAKYLTGILTAFLTAHDELCRIDGNRHALLIGKSDEAMGLRAKSVIEFALQRQGIAAEISSVCYRPGDDVDDILALLKSDISETQDLQSPTLVVLDEQMREIYQLVDRIAPTDLSVLVLGETGVGKEVIARAIHDRSSRRHRRFLALNCAGVPEALLESELFGFHKGAFTGADTDKQGLLEAANGGTVFLDEVAEMPPATQAKLLRVVEEQAVRRLGALTARPIDVRFIAATHRALKEHIEDGRFREDLFYRLSGMTISVPPLRERPHEIVPLARVFAHQASRKTHTCHAPEFTTEALSVLENEAWPGNVRELRHAVERAVALCGIGPIEPGHFALGNRLTSCSVSSSTNLGSAEKQEIVEALEACGGNQTRAAQVLGISRKSLIRRLDRYDIPRPRKPL